MKLPFDLLSQNYTKPDLYLCETDKTKICKLEVTDMQAIIKFNAYSELTFTIGRTYDDMIAGEQKVNPFYKKIEALRLVYLDGFGYFEIQDPNLVSDGIQEKKEVSAYSLEYNLSQKYLENFYINTGEIDSVEVIYAEDNDTEIAPVTLYNPANKKLSLLHLITEKIYGWTIGHVDLSLYTISRTFEISRSSVYDFIMQDICDKFNCFVVFDTEDNTINFYSEVLISKFIGDGESVNFITTTPYNSIGSVTIDTYKTKDYTYDESTGILTFNTPPPNGSMIEVRDGAQTQWLTDVYVSFDNLAQEVSVSYTADDIKTVLTVKGADDLDIREVNFGLPYITDLSYYYNVDWMGQDLYDAYEDYLKLCNSKQNEYTENSKNMIDTTGYITYEEQRMSHEYLVAPDVTSITVGTYYVRGGVSPNYYYREVSLPSEYKAGIEYYTLSGAYIYEKKVTDLYTAIQNYYVSETDKDVTDIQKLKDDFSCMKTNTIDVLVSALSNANTTADKDTAVKSFLSEMWDQFGKSPLTSLYLSQYKTLKEANVEAGWDEESNANYWRYYPVNLMISTIESAIADRDKEIDRLRADYEALVSANADISEMLLIDNNFTDKQLLRLSAFLREDEYTDDNFVETDSDTIETLMKTKQELLECGRIELSKLCSPKLEFSMDMANIFALREFDPIVNQFQLGNLINVVIRSDYIKQARLLEVNINFEDFSDFSCEFGELTNLKTPSSIHADLLASAISAGKSVASNASYWNKGSDTAISTDLKLQQGLLDSTNAIKAIDGTQGVVIDKYGIHLRKIDPDTGELDKKEGWIVNNQILYSDDNFETARSVFGEYKIDNQTYWGLLAEAMIAGYIEGSRIVGGTINIGDGTFMVDEFGNVTMKASSIEGYAGIDNIISSINQSPESIAIDASKISLAGKTIDLTSDNIAISSTNFSVTKDGKITATSGEIAGWTIYDHLLRKETTIDDVDYQMYMQAADGTDTINAFAVRKKSTSDTDWDVQFSVNYAGKLTAKNANITGTITAQDGSIAGYYIGPGGSYDNALYKRVSGDSADYEVGLKATNGDTDLAFYVKKSTDNWESSSNTFYVNNSGKLYAQNADITGKITASSGTIGGWTIGETKIYGTSDTGNVAVMQLPTSDTTFVFAAGGTSHDSYSSCPFRVSKDGKLYASKGIIGGFDISDAYLRSDITLYATRYQTFMQAADGTDTTTAFGVRYSTDGGDTWTYQFRVNYDGSATLRNATITGSSTIAAACIPDLDAGKITSGTISTSRLSSSVITTSNFSSKTLSTGNLSVTNGGNIGIWTVNSNNYLYAISGSYGVSLSATSVSHGQGGSATWVSIVTAGQNASDERLKKNIAGFDDKFDNIFDNLKPVQFEYSEDFLGKGVRLGYIAQDVIKSFEDEGEDINNYSFIYETEIEDNSTDKYYQLNKTDFIALNTWQIQKLKARETELEAKVAALEAKLASLGI